MDRGNDVKALFAYLGAKSNTKYVRYPAASVVQAANVLLQYSPTPKGKDPFTNMTKEVYKVVADAYGTTPGNVYHEVQHLVKNCWDAHSERFERALNFMDKPRPKDFILLLARTLAEEARGGAPPQWLKYVEKRRTNPLDRQNLTHYNGKQGEHPPGG